MVFESESELRFEERRKRKGREDRGLEKKGEGQKGPACATGLLEGEEGRVFRGQPRAATYLLSPCAGRALSTCS